MAELMRQDRLDLRGRKTGDDGVEQHDALRRAEAGEEGVAMAGALARIHLEEALGAEATALQQGFDLAPQRGVVDRLQLVEQWHDEGRDDQQHEEIETDIER